MQNINYIGFEEIDSTNSYALENIKNLDDKTIIFAHRQTNGRGRFNRVWESDNSENLYFTIVLKPCTELDSGLPFANLTQYMSVILCQILEKYGTAPQIKWPNDVLIDGKKISGILAETSIKSGKLEGLVLGVGFNLNSSAEEIAKIDQKATSLNLEIDKKVDKELFLREIVSRFFEKYDEFLSTGFIMIKNDYTQRCSFLGSQITVKELGTSVDAIAESILDDGSLRVKTNDTTKTLKTGDILLG